MEQSDELDRTINGCLIFLFSLATLSVLGYMLFGLAIFVYLALGVYTFSK